MKEKDIQKEEIIDQNVVVVIETTEETTGIEEIIDLTTTTDLLSEIDLQEIEKIETEIQDLQEKKESLENPENQEKKLPFQLLLLSLLLLEIFHLIWIKKIYSASLKIKEDVRFIFHVCSSFYTVNRLCRLDFNITRKIENPKVMDM